MGASDRSLDSPRQALLRRWLLSRGWRVQGAMKIPGEEGRARTEVKRREWPGAAEKQAGGHWSCRDEARELHVSLGSLWLSDYWRPGEPGELWAQGNMIWLGFSRSSDSEEVVLYAQRQFQQHTWREAVLFDYRTVKTHSQWSDSEYIWRVEPTGFPDGFNVCFERRKEVKDNFKVSGLTQVEEIGCQHVKSGSLM